MNAESKRKARLDRLAKGLCPCGQPLSNRINTQTGKRLTTCDPCADVRLQRDRDRRAALRKARDDSAARSRQVAELRAENKPVPLTPAQVEARIRREIWLEVKDAWEGSGTNGEFSRWVAARVRGA